MPRPPVHATRRSAVHVASLGIVLGGALALPAGAAAAQEGRQPAIGPRTVVGATPAEAEAVDAARQGTHAGAARAPRVRLALAEARVRVGAPVTARVRVEAPAGKTRFTTPSGCLADVEVLDARGRVHAGSGQMCGMALTPRTVAPGAPLVATVTVDGGTRDAPTLAPGRWRVRAVVVRWDDATGRADTLRSAPVPLRVVR